LEAQILSPPRERSESVLAACRVADLGDPIFCERAEEYALGLAPFKSQADDEMLTGPLPGREPSLGARSLGGHREKNIILVVPRDVR
jgi:hypothetical protein